MGGDGKEGRTPLHPSPPSLPLSSPYHPRGASPTGPPARAVARTARAAAMAMSAPAVGAARSVASAAAGARRRPCAATADVTNLVASEDVRVTSRERALASRASAGAGSLRAAAASAAAVAGDSASLRDAASLLAAVRGVAWTRRAAAAPARATIAALVAAASGSQQPPSPLPAAAPRAKPPRQARVSVDASPDPRSARAAARRRPPPRAAPPAMGKHNGKARAQGLPVGAALTNRQKSRRGPAGEPTASTGRHTTELGPGMQSVLEASDLGELMDMVCEGREGGMGGAPAAGAGRRPTAPLFLPRL